MAYEIDDIFPTRLIYIKDITCNDKEDWFWYWKYDHLFLRVDPCLSKDEGYEGNYKSCDNSRIKIPPEKMIQQHYH